MNNVNNESTSFQVQIENLKQNLQQNPKKASLLAITYFTRYLKISSEYQKLQQLDWVWRGSLATPLVQNEPKLFPVPTNPEIEEAHHSLLLAHGQLHLENERLRKKIEQLEQDYQNLVQVIEAIIDENAPLPDCIV